jgi:hypothetical protein
MEEAENDEEMNLEKVKRSAGFQAGSSHIAPLLFCS